MATENVFAQLRTILARLYPEAMDARRVGADTAVALERVALTGSTLNMWDALAREVQNDQKLPTLLAVVCADYPTNDELLTAVAACKASLSHAAPMPAHSAATLAPPPLLPTFTAAPTLQEHGLTWLQPFLTRRRLSASPLHSLNLPKARRTPSAYTMPQKRSPIWKNA